MVSFAQEVAEILRARDRALTVISAPLSLMLSSVQEDTIVQVSGIVPLWSVILELTTLSRVEPIVRHVQLDIFVLVGAHCCRNYALVVMFVQPLPCLSQLARAKGQEAPEHS